MKQYEHGTFFKNKFNIEQANLTHEQLREYDTAKARTEKQRNLLNEKIKQLIGF